MRSDLLWVIYPDGYRGAIAAWTARAIATSTCYSVYECDRYGERCVGFGDAR